MEEKEERREAKTRRNQVAGRTALPLSHAQTQVRVNTIRLPKNTECTYNGMSSSSISRMQMSLPLKMEAYTFFRTSLSDLLSLVIAQITSQSFWGKTSCLRDTQQMKGSALRVHILLRTMASLWLWENRDDTRFWSGHRWSISLRLLCFHFLCLSKTACGDLICLILSLVNMLD